MEDRKLATIVVPVFLSFFAILAIALRLLARRLKRVKLGSDDWTIIIAVVISLPHALRVVHNRPLTVG